MTLHLFNPSHDDALADGTPYYCSSEAARTLEARLWAMPSLWASRGDVIVRPKGVSTDGAPFLTSDAEWVDECDLHKVNPDSPFAAALEQMMAEDEEVETISEEDA